MEEQNDLKIPTKKKRNRFITVNAPDGYRIVKQTYLQDSPKKIRIFFEIELNEKEHK